MEQEKKGCNSCGKSQRGLEFTKREKILAGVAVVILFLTVYGIIELAKGIISLF